MSLVESQSAPSSGDPATGLPKLYGRDAERVMLHDLIARARGFESRSIVLLGPAGIGKSALIEDCLARAEGMRVLKAGGVAVEAELAFAGLHQLLRPLLGALPEVPAPQSAALASALGLVPGAHDDPFLVGAGVLSLLAAAAEKRPLVCVVEDAHWLDRPSTEALAFAARRLGAEPIVFVFSARDVKPPPLADLPELRLERLADADAASLLDMCTQVPLAASVRERILATAEGNPLALLELPQALSTEELLGQKAVADALPLTVRLEEAFHARLASLSEPSQLFLLLAAADTSRDAANVLKAAEALGIDARDIASVEDGGLLRLSEESLTFRHPVVRCAVYQQAPFTARRRVHDALASVLTGERDADRRAWHLAAATVEPDDAVADELERTAERARARGGHSSAAAALVRAAALTVDPEKRAARELAAAGAAAQAGENRLATAQLESARSLTGNGVLLAEAEHLRALIELQEGSPSVALEIFLAAASEVEDVDPPRASRILLDAARAAVYAGNLASQVAVGRRASALLPKLGPTFELGLAAGLGLLWDDEPERGRALLEDAIGQVEATDNPRRFQWAAICSLQLGDESAARAFATRDAALARREGAISSLGTTLSRLAFAEILEGRFDSARASAAEGLALAEQTGLENIACYHHALLAWVAALLGRSEETGWHAARSLAMARGGDRAFQTAVTAIALGELELGLGQPERALGHFCAVSSRGSRGAHPSLGVRIAPSQVLVAVRARRPELAREPLAAFERWVSATGSRSQLPLLARSRALLADGRAGFDEALRLHAEVPRPYETARTELLYGERLRRSGQRLEARAHLEAALDVFGQLGAEAWAAQAEEELRATGAMLSTTRPARGKALTPQELQVARLVAAGAANKEVAAQLFVSPRTVDAHLRTIFRKLGITSRSQLARLRLGDPGESEDDGDSAISPMRR